MCRIQRVEADGLPSIEATNTLLLPPPPALQTFIRSQDSPPPPASRNFCLSQGSPPPTPINKTPPTPEGGVVIVLMDESLKGYQNYNLIDDYHD